MEVRDFAQHHEPVPLGNGVTATRQQIQQWLTEKAEEQTWYLRWTFVAAAAAVLVGLKYSFELVGIWVALSQAG
jgi:hypothetical protein